MASNPKPSAAKAAPKSNNPILAGVDALKGVNQPAADSGAPEGMPSAEELAREMAERPGELERLRQAIALHDASSAGAGASEGEQEETVRVYHLGRHSGSIVHGPYSLGPGDSLVVPKSIAALWLTHKGPTGLDLFSTNPATDGARTTAEERLEKEKTELAGENVELKTRLENLEKLLVAMKSGGAQTTRPTPPAGQ